jgi:glycosyltransferase involved in cell wall biosynthesis
VLKSPRADPALARLPLPVFVLDRYEGLEAEYPAEHRELASFASGDEDDLAEKLQRLLSLSPRERAELGRAARRAAEKRWSWEGVASRLLEPFL